MKKVEDRTRSGGGIGSKIRGVFQRIASAIAAAREPQKTRFVLPDELFEIPKPIAAPLQPIPKTELETDLELLSKAGHSSQQPITFVEVTAAREAVERVKEKYRAMAKQGDVRAKAALAHLEYQGIEVFYKVTEQGGPRLDFLGKIAYGDKEEGPLKVLFEDLNKMSVEELRREKVPPEHLTILAKYLSSEADRIEYKLVGDASKYNDDKKGLLELLNDYCVKAEKALALIVGSTEPDVNELRKNSKKILSLQNKLWKVMTKQLKMGRVTQGVSSVRMWRQPFVGVCKERFTWKSRTCIACRNNGYSAVWHTKHLDCIWTTIQSYIIKLQEEVLDCNKYFISAI